TTIVVVSHQPETLEKYCRSAGVLMNGQLQMFDTLEEARQLYDYQTQS
ncbi:MAG: ABC transporter, partial [Paracoccaceae bacterium]|nr:ABC transporter [Paracoccaceae bacterium]